MRPTCDAMAHCICIEAMHSTHMHIFPALYRLSNPLCLDQCLQNSMQVRSLRVSCVDDLPFRRRTEGWDSGHSGSVRGRDIAVAVSETVTITVIVIVIIIVVVGGGIGIRIGIGVSVSVGIGV